MKKLLCAVLLISLLMCSTISAGIAESYAEGYTDVSSVMTMDSVQSFTAEPYGSVELLQPYPELIALLEELYDFVWNQQNRSVGFYGEDVQNAIQVLVPEVDVNNLYMTEYMGLQLSIGDERGESVAMRVELEPDYAPGQLIVAVMGIQNADDSWSWYPYRGNVPETGVICWDMPIDEFVALTLDRSVLHILTIRSDAGNQGQETDENPVETARPSKQVSDLTNVTGWESTSDAAIEDSFRIFFVDLTEPMQAETLRMETFIEEGHAPIEWFPEEIQNQAREMKQDGIAVDEMVIYDGAAVMAENYQDTYGDVATENSFPTSYSADKEMFALLGFWQSDENEFEWYYLRANGVENTTNVEIVYKQLILPMMEERPAMLIVFSEPLIKDETKE